MHSDDKPWIIPPASYDLIDDLDAMYPPRTIRRGESLEEAHRYAGKRELIDELLLKREEETNDAVVSRTSSRKSG